MAGRLDGKVALITGAAAGIGRAAVLAFCREGARVLLADVAAEGGEETLDLARAAGGEASFMRADVTQDAQVAALVEAAVARYGRLDCAFNNAGIGGIEAPTHEYPEAMFRRVIDVNLIGVWLCMKYEIAQMLRQGGGSIVNTSSVLGLGGWAAVSAYVASKHGVIGLTRTGAVEYSARGIRVNAVCPGWVHTAMSERELTTPGLGEWILSQHPIGRAGSPEEIAETAVWLCSDAASFVTGAALAADGGYTAH